MFFTRKKAPEIISIHIPKTAGTSFRNILKSVYGEKDIVRFDINEKGVVRMNEELYLKTALPGVRVIHGHFSFRDLAHKFSLPEEYKLITWMRDPAERVISNFYYLEKRLAELLDEEKNNLNIISKMQRSLIEYARAEVNRNRQAKFLDGAQPDDFDFIGIVEDFDSELARLSSVLNWPEVPGALYQNETGGKRRVIEESILSEIRDLNERDMELYRKAKDIRNSILQ